MSARQTIAKFIAGESKAAVAKPAETRRANSSIQASTRVLSGMSSWNDVMNYAGEGSAISPELAMAHTTFFACVRLISFTIGMLPLPVYVTNAAGDRERAADLAEADLLNERPNARQSATMFWRCVAARMVTHGNTYVWMERKNRLGSEIIAFHFVQTVHKRIIKSGPLQGRIVYTMKLDDGRDVAADQDDVLHFPGTSEMTSDGAEAKSPLQAYAEAIDIGHEANKQARLYFKNAAVPPGYITYPEGKKIDDREQAQEILDYWHGEVGGENKGRTGILTEGGKFVQLSISAADAQLLESRKFQAEDVCRALGVPPHMVGLSGTTSNYGTGIYEQTEGFLTYTIGGHLAAIEKEINWKVFRFAKPRPFVEFNRRALVQTNIEKRFAAYRVALGGSSGPGFMGVDEVRKLENLPALGGNYAKPQEWKPTAATSAASEGSKDEDDPDKPKDGDGTQ